VPELRSERKMRNTLEINASGIARTAEVGVIDTKKASA